MEKKKFEELMSKAEGFRYSSLKYIDYEDIMHYDIITDSDELLFMYGYNNTFKNYKYLYACNSFEVLSNALCDNKECAMLTFVPEDWVAPLEALGFKMFAIWNEYFNWDMEVPEGLPEPEFLKAEECQEASDVTQSCRYQSRGFTGQTPEWIEKWISGQEIDYGKDFAVIVHRIDGKIAGLLCTCTYGHDSTKGPIVWVRELAVRPEFQNRGIGRLLINQTLAYGKAHGATRSFLAADECNKNAIHLYESTGYKCNKDGREINMIREK